MAKELQQLSQEWDDDMVRSVHFCNTIDDAMTPYKTIFAQKKKQRQQLPINMFFSRKKQPPSSPQATDLFRCLRFIDRMAIGRVLIGRSKALDQSELSFTPSRGVFNFHRY
ncbi:hypothetical protein SK128_025337, partial [Halocaridina rubra]